MPPPPHAYQAMTAMANQALQNAMDTHSVTAIAAALEEHHLYCNSQVVQEARALRDHLKKAAKKAKKQPFQQQVSVPLEISFEEASLEVVPLEEEPSNDDIGISVTECVVCLDAQPTHILVPCGHQCVCEACIFVGDECPMCRASVTHKVKVFK